jgi:hypothetical protein
VRTATHESGHALVAAMLLGSDVIKLITIEGVSRRASAGHVSFRRPGWNHCKSATFLAIMLGGAAAESLAFGEHDPEGAIGDLERARRVSGNDAELDRAWALALELLDRRWPALERVASALLAIRPPKRRSLSTQRVRELIENA